MAIYFLRIAGDPPEAPVKIGHAKNPVARLVTIQTGHYRDYVFIRVVTGTPVEEYLIHQRFQHLRIRGEWFRFDPAMLGDLGLRDLPIPVASPPSLRGGPMTESHRLAIAAGVKRSWGDGAHRARRFLRRREPPHDPPNAPKLPNLPLGRPIRQRRRCGSPLPDGRRVLLRRAAARNAGAARGAGMTQDNDVLVELCVVIDGDAIMSRKLVERCVWESLWRSKTYLPNLVAAFERNISRELHLRADKPAVRP